MRRSLRLWMIFALLAAGLTPLAALAQAPSKQVADRELQSELEDVFEVLPLSSGFVLEPHDEDAGYRSLEIAADGSVLVDGKTPDESQSLRDRIGSPAYRVVAKIRKLDEAQRRELLAATAEGRELPEAEDAAGGELPVPPAPPGAPAVPAVPAPPLPPRIHSDAKVSVGSGVTVDEDEVVTEDVVAVGGPLEIHGEVRGDAVAIGGPAEIDGRVTGEVVVIGGSVTLGPNADIGRDVTSVGGKVERDVAAKVGGKVSEVAFGTSAGLGIFRSLRHLRGHDKDWTEGWEFSPFRHFTGLLVKLFAFIVVALFACLVLLVARSPLQRVERKVAEEPWKAGLVGLVSQIAFLPLLAVTCVILAVSIIGIPLLLLVPFVLVGVVLMAFLGYAAVAYRVGRWVEERFNWRGHNDYWVLVVGLGLLAAFGFVSRALDFHPLGFFSGMLAFVGFMVQYAAWTVGFGGALLTRFGAGPRTAAAAAPPPAAPPAAALESDVSAAPAAPAASDAYEGSPWEGETAAGEPPGDDTPR